MAENTTTIKLDRETRDMLEKFKIIPREPLAAVVRRIVEAYLESNTELNAVTAKILDDRLEKVSHGSVFSGADMLKRIKKNR